MTIKTWLLSGDLARSWAYVAVAIAVLAVALLVREIRRGEGGAFVVLLSGVLATALLAGAVLRPVRVTSRGAVVGPRVVVLADRSLSMQLPGDHGTRDQTLRTALAGLRQSAPAARYAIDGFSEGEPVPWDPSDASSSATGTRSDLSEALGAVARSAEERPSAIVVISDGRFDRPTADAAEAGVKGALAGLAVPVHTVSVAEVEPPDASIRAVRAAGAAVAHQPLPLSIDIGCSGGLSCDGLTVSARELVEGGSPAVLATGVAHLDRGLATVELSVTLERAGSRIVELEIDTPSGDTVPDNNRRYLALDVARDRVRVLHVAGRPTYDVRALRMWLKADASVDVVTFFILRTHNESRDVPASELSLIPFPVHELFSEQLPTFDAIVLQDFNAVPYELVQHLPALAEYVRRGGGLIMVGGPDSFAGGHYAGTELAGVLPVELGLEPGRESFDPSVFVPEYTDVGRAAPILRGLRSTLGEDLPEMAGANWVGDAHAGAMVLFTHPRLRTRTGAPMPLLALGEEGDGRSIAMAFDGSYRLAYSTLGADTAGRAYGTLWDGLLGWLMRDPRYEPAQVSLVGRCVAGVPASLHVVPLPGTSGQVRVEVIGLGDSPSLAERTASLAAGEPVTIDLGALAPGGYTARVRIGNQPATRRDFACERGGDDWADSRPDEDRLRAIAVATGGTFVRASDAGKIPLPAATQIAAERQVTAVLPPWVWTLAASLALGAHWIARRRVGLV